jgi:hypothetical protein
MKQAFPRTGITHVKGISTLNNIVLHEIDLYQSVDTFYTNVGRDVSGFQVSYQ